MKTKKIQTVARIISLVSLAIILMGFLSSEFIPEINPFIDGIIKHENLYLAAAFGILVSPFIDLMIEPPPEIQYS